MYAEAVAAVISLSVNHVLCDVQNLPVEATIGPQARASAPIDRKTPVIAPFWFSGPIRVTNVIMHVTTMAVAVSTYM